MPCSRLRIVATSRKLGTLDRCKGSAVSRLAHMMGNAAFLAPEMRISPRSGPLPVRRSLSMRRSLQRRPRLRREGLHGQGVDLFAHAIAQGAVHELMLLDPAEPGKALAHDDRFEVMAVAPDLDVLAGQMGGNGLSDVVRFDHAGFLLGFNVAVCT